MPHPVIRVERTTWPFNAASIKATSTKTSRLHKDEFRDSKAIASPGDLRRDRPLGAHRRLTANGFVLPICRVFSRLESGHRHACVDPEAAVWATGGPRESLVSMFWWMPERQRPIRRNLGMSRRR